MKILKSGALCVLLCACVFSMSAQQGFSKNEPDQKKPKLFADLPNKFHFDVASFEGLLDKPVGEKVNIHLTGSFNYQGVVVSKSNPQDGNTKSIVIKSTNRQGAVLTFTRNKAADGSYAYLGRIMSRDHSDIYQIEKEEGQYILVKKDLDDLMNE